MRERGKKEAKTDRPCHYNHYEETVFEVRAREREGGPCCECVQDTNAHEQMHIDTFNMQHTDPTRTNSSMPIPN